MNHKTKTAILVLGLVAGTLAVPASATPGSHATGTTLARGVSSDRIISHAKRPFEVVVQHITIAPGGHTGWHTHPGNAIAVVKAGTLTIYNGRDRTCTGRDYTAGEVYLDPGRGWVHMARNESPTTPVEVVVTYLDVPVGGGVRDDSPNPGHCPF